MTKLYDFHSLNDLAKELRRPKASLHVLDPSGDPFNCGSPAQIEASKWFADLWREHISPEGISGGSITSLWSWPTPRCSAAGPTLTTTFATRS
jgi:hypothetical protein